MCSLGVDAPHVELEGVPVTRKVLCAQLDAYVRDTAMGAPILLLRRLQTNTIAVNSCSMYNTVSTELSIIIYCLLL